MKVPKQNKGLCCADGYELSQDKSKCVVKSPRYCADFTGNGEVDFEDFFVFSDGWKSGDYIEKLDLDKDGQVYFNDFFIFADEFGKEPVC